MSEIAEKLEEICRALESADVQAPDETGAWTARISQKAALAMTREMVARLHAGSSGEEVTAALPFALAFLVNVCVYCTPSAGDPATVDRIFEAAARFAHDLGDGAALPTRHGTSVGPH